jgi:DNA-binding NarL/FixJ family response regulator
LKKRVVIVDDHVSIRQMLALILRREPDYEVVGEAGTGLQAVEVCQQCAPELVILDVVLPELCGMEVVRRLRAHGSPPRVLVYSGIANRNQVIQVLKCRPHGFVEKLDTLDTLREAIRVVAGGGLYFTPFATRLFTECYEPHDASDLTDREREVLQMIAEGRSSKEISTLLSLAVKTVENHRAHLMAKLHLHGVASLTRYAVKLGIVALD